MRRLIVGTGRSGTRYSSNLLTAAGLRCGHEEVYAYRGVLRDRPVDWGSFDAEASWMAVPDLPTVDAAAALVVRNPLDVVTSMMSLNWFAPTRKVPTRIARKHRPEILAEKSRADRCLALWWHWNISAVPYVRGVVRLEDLGPGGEGVVRLLDLLDVDGRPDPEELAAIRADGERSNTKADKKNPVPAAQWGDFRPRLADTAMKLADQFGYSVP